MSTFSHCNSPGCCGMPYDDIDKLRNELESLRTSFSQLNEKLSAYPNADKAYIKSLTVDTIEVLQKLITSSIDIIAQSIAVTGAVTAGTYVSAKDAKIEGTVSAATIKAGQGEFTEDVKIKGNIHIDFNTITKRLEAIEGFIKTLKVSETLAVEKEAYFNSSIKVIKDIMAAALSTQSISTKSASVSDKITTKVIDVEIITLARAIIKETISIAGKLTAQSISAASLQLDDYITARRIYADDSVETSVIHTREPRPKNLISYTNGVTVEIYHLFGNAHTEIPYYLGGNENAHFDFFAFKIDELPRSKYFYTEHGRYEIFTGMKALILRIDERLDPNNIIDIPNIYTATVSGDSVIWRQSTNVVAPARHNKNGWRFHIEFIKSYLASNNEQVYDHEFHLCWLPYSSKTNTVDVGNNDYNLTLHSHIRPTVDENGALYKVAYLSDLAGSITYQGKCDIYETDISRLPQIGQELNVNASGTEKITVSNGFTALIIATNEEKEAAIYKLSNGVWIKDNTVAASKNRAYQWHIEYLKENKDAYWHEAEVIWAPYVPQAEKVSIINLPLENYYNIDQIEAIKKVLINLATTQTNWLDRRRVVVRDGVQYDNPAYLLNRPVTGVSLLDGGNWDNGYPHPQFVVLGGNFDELETNTKHILDADNEYQNCIIRVMHGQKASLPQAREKTKNALKWCEDTAELFLDCFELQDDPSLQMHLNKGNFLLRSKKELQFVASLLWEADNANASAVLNKLVSLRNTEFPVNEEATKTNTVNYSGIRADNGQLYPFAFELKGSDRVRFKKTTRSDKHDNISDSNIDYYKRDNDIIVDVVVDDIIAYLKDSDKRITQIEDLDIRWNPDGSNASEIKEINEYRGQKFEVVEDSAKTNKCKVFGTRIKNGTSIVEAFEYPITVGKRMRINKTTGDDPEIIVDIVLDDLLAHSDMLAKRTRTLEDLDVRYTASTKDAVVVNDGFGVIAVDNTKTNACKVAGTRINNGNGEVEQFEYNITCDKRIRISKNDSSINISLVYADIIGAIKANKTAIDNEKQVREQKDTELQTAINNEKQVREQKDTELQTAINNEKQAREQKDTELQTAINNEKQARIEADNELRRAVSTISDVSASNLDSAFFSLTSSGGINIIKKTAFAVKSGNIVQLRIDIEKTTDTTASSIVLSNIPAHLVPASFGAGIISYGRVDNLGIASFFESNGATHLCAYIDSEKMPQWKSYNKATIDIVYVARK